MTWHVAVLLEAEVTALARSPPLDKRRFALSVSLRASNASLMELALGSQLALPYRYLCCGAYQDFIVTDVTRSLALRVEVTVHSGALKAIYLKHSACARYPDDVGDDEACIGACEMKWLTTYDPFSIAPTYATRQTVTVPMGIVYADERAPGEAGA